MPARRRVPFSALALVASIAQLALAPTPSGAAPPCLLPPVAAPVVDRFREPPCPYCAGNRGLELAPAAGSAVVAAAPGRVSFSGSVAGVRYVVVEHPSGHRTTYGRLAGFSVRTGALVAAGTPVGTSSDRLFFGLRLGEQYVDPAPHLATVRARPQLVPLDGRNRLPARPAAVTCPAGGGGGGAFR